MLVVIRTNGGALNIGSLTAVAKGQIQHYGVVRETTVYTEENCFHTYGAVGIMNLKAGKAIAEDGGIVYLTTANMGVKIEEQGTGKVFIPENTTQAEDGTGVPVSVASQINITPIETNASSTYANASKTGGNVYGIGTLSELEQFRDLVNSGFNFDGIKVELTADITLKDGWTPIGEGSRKTGAVVAGAARENWTYSGNVYKGEFDGNNHTIYNLNNKGYVPSTNALGDDNSNKVYAYGFFSILAGNASIHDLYFENVDIDTSRYSASNDTIKGDSVAALVGFSAGNLTVDNVKVLSGTIKAYECAGGIIGRMYSQDSNSKVTISIQNCINKASVSSSNNQAGGIFGYCYINKATGSKFEVKDNTVEGYITISAPLAAGIGVLEGGSFFTTSGSMKNNFDHSGNSVNSTVTITGGNKQAKLFAPNSTGYDGIESE